MRVGRCNSVSRCKACEILMDSGLPPAGEIDDGDDAGAADAGAGEASIVAIMSVGAPARRALRTGVVTK